MLLVFLQELAEQMHYSNYLKIYTTLMEDVK